METWGRSRTSLAPERSGSVWVTQELAPYQLARDTPVSFPTARPLPENLPLGLRIYMGTWGVRE